MSWSDSFVIVGIPLYVAVTWPPIREPTPLILLSWLIIGAAWLLAIWDVVNEE